MSNTDPTAQAFKFAPARRHLVIAGGALLLGTLFTASGRTQTKAQTAHPAALSQAADLMRTALHQEVDFKPHPACMYEALLDSGQFSAFSGETSHIDRREGGALSMFGGKIVGRIVELVPTQRIVQAWRPTHWDPGVYSVVKFVLRKYGTGTRIVLDHTGFPEGDFEHLNAGWKMRYWDPLEKYLT